MAIYNRIIFIGVSTAMLAGILSLSSCSEREETTSHSPNAYTHELTFSIDSADAWNDASKTRASESKTKLLSENSFTYNDRINGHKFVLRMTEWQGIDSADTISVTTRATAIPSNDELDLGVYAYLSPKGNETVAPVYNGTKAKEFMINQLVDISEGYSYSPMKYWPGPNYWLNFFAYRPYISNINKENNTYLTLDVTENKPTMTYNVPTNVAHQVDLLATSTETLAGNFGKTVDLPFAHMLSAVKFKVGYIPAAEITNIALKNIVSKGRIDIKKDGVWDGLSGKNDFSQTLTGFKVSENSGKQVGKTFYMMPQSFSDDSELSITVRFGSNNSYRDYPLTVFLKDFCAEWKQGHTYVYTLTTPEEIDMEIEEDFTQHGSVKNDVYFINTGLVPINIRATIVGYWVVNRELNGQERECVIAAWKPDTDGTFIGLPGNGWSREADGFYYYNTVLERGEQTTDLFDSYKLNTNPPAVGAELVLTVVGQARLDGYSGVSWNSISSSN